MKEVLEKSQRLSGKRWIRAYKDADRMTKIAMLSHALWVHKIASLNYGYLSYLYDVRFPKYQEYEEKVLEIERNIG
jgi:hypothetical protein